MVLMCAAAVSYMLQPGGWPLAVLILPLAVLSPFCPFPVPAPLIVRGLLALATGGALAVSIKLFQLGYPGVGFGMIFTAATTGFLFGFGHLKAPR